MANDKLTITLTQYQLDVLATYLDDDTREAVHDERHATPDAYVRAYAQRNRDDLLGAAALCGMTDTVRAVLAKQGDSGMANE